MEMEYILISKNTLVVLRNIMCLRHILMGCCEVYILINYLHVNSLPMLKELNKGRIG